ncbi:MAG: bifunctional pyr operon transcriptional regulator/uracil phosphoribosyltransferase PyrR [Phycisphaera sp.]|nr:bifunctional pyr operon transcriptional regulator/uracil phosphoribosyltransferase PyrR [Phycisphaera sp.]
MRVIADADKVKSLSDELCRSIAQGLSPKSGQPWALVGLRSRGDLLAQRLAKTLKPEHVGSIDITLYRDDLSEIGSQPLVRTTEIDFAIDGLNVVLVDDVLMTGRSIRAAMQSLIDLGRPRRVWLAVLVDRGGRELPISPDFAALDLTGKSRRNAVGEDELVEVYLEPADPCDAIVVRNRTEQGNAIP